MLQQWRHLSDMLPMKSSKMFDNKVFKEFMWAAGSTSGMYSRIVAFN